MKLDCSEVKSFRHCQRRWQFESRNSFHLAPKVTPKAFKIGTVFHESLHRLYLGKSIDFVEQYIYDEMQGEEEKDINMLRSMIKGYDKEVMPQDRERFEVLDIEHHFVLNPMEVLELFGVSRDSLSVMDEQRLSDIEIHGSIDMLAVDKETHAVYGFEHKTAKNFRNTSYLWMDEQPRLYYIALVLYVAAKNFKADAEWKADGCPEDKKPIEYKVGGIYINEVRKLIRMFETKRSSLSYKSSDIKNFMLAFFASCSECHKVAHDEDIPRIPQPDYMTCANCSFNHICEKYMYSDIDLSQLLEDFKEEYKVREVDHLEEKQEVNV